MIVGGAARNGKIYFGDTNLTKNFATLRAVLQFCQANDVFTSELARRLALNNGAYMAAISTCYTHKFMPRWACSYI